MALPLQKDASSVVLGRWDPGRERGTKGWCGHFSVLGGPTSGNLPIPRGSISATQHRALMHFSSRGKVIH